MGKRLNKMLTYLKKINHYVFFPNHITFGLLLSYTKIIYLINMSHFSLFSEFTPSTKAEWLAKIERDLKGRSIESLTWHLSNPDNLEKTPPLSISPFTHPEDLLTLPEPLIGERAANVWNIGENIYVTEDVKLANSKAVTGLMGGVNAPCFIFTDKFPSEKQLEELLKDIELDYIAVFFKESTENQSPLAFLKNLKRHIDKKQENDVTEFQHNKKENNVSTILRGGVFYDPFADGRFDTVSATETVRFAAENFPQMSVLSVNGERFFDGTNNVVDELLHTLKAGEQYLKKLTDKGLDAKTINKALNFRFQIGLSYFVEIAKLRAFKILWGNVLEAYGIEPTMPTIFASTTDKTYSADPHTNKIRTTTQAMSAVIGGAVMLTLQPTEDNDLGRRMARNVQHLLGMESYLDKVVDPSAGSYYIETLTTKLAEAVWERFTK
jgi:methylmalonyl-CoA mutase